MTKIFLTGLLAFGISATCDAGQILLNFGSIGSATTVHNTTGSYVYIHRANGYPDITFYDSMDSSTTGRSPSKGSGTLTITGDTITPGSPLGSNSVASLNGATNVGFKRITVDAAGNLNYSAGAAGFFFVWDTASSDSSCALGFKKSGDAGDKFAFRKGTSGNSWSFKYEDVTVTTVLAAGTTAYIEIAWDHDKVNGFCARVRQDGGAWATSNDCTGSAPSNSTFGILGDSLSFGGGSIDGRMDEVIISNDSTRNLYAIRDLGSYPN